MWNLRSGGWYFPVCKTTHTLWQCCRSTCWQELCSPNYQLCDKRGVTVVRQYLNRTKWYVATIVKISQYKLSTCNGHYRQYNRCDLNAIDFIALGQCVVLDIWEIKWFAFILQEYSNPNTEIQFMIFFNFQCVQVSFVLRGGWGGGGGGGKAEYTWGQFYKHGLTLIPTWISIYIHYKVWDEITYPFPNFNCCAIDVW